MIGIYKITNTINNKIYIGQSVNIHRRWRQHINRAGQDNTPLHSAIYKYGIDNFVFEIVEECTIDLLDSMEQKWIQYYNSIIPHGYNVSLGGQRSKGAVYAHFDSLEIEDIVHLLQHNFEITINEIAAMYGVSFQTISDINTGRSYVNEQLKYPLRERYAAQRKDYKCTICGAPVYRGSVCCAKCAQEANRKVERPDKISLAKEIVECGFEATGRKYGVSGNAIKKWCKEYGIPYLKNELKEWYRSH